MAAKESSCTNGDHFRFPIGRKEVESHESSKGNTHARFVPMMPRSIFATALVIALAVSQALGETFRDDARHFQVDLPMGWSVMSPQELGEFNANARQSMPNQKIEYIAGFRLAKSAPGTYPYVLVQLLPGKVRGATYEDLERSLAKEVGNIKSVESTLGDQVKNMNVGDVFLERSRNRIVMRISMDVNGVGRVLVHSVGHIGADHLVLLHGYASERSFEEFLPTAHAFAESFRFDSGHTFVPGRGGFDWNRTVLMGVLGGVVGGIFALVRYVRSAMDKRFQKRKKKAKRRAKPKFNDRDESEELEDDSPRANPSKVRESIQFDCPNCDKTLRAKARYVGAKVRCPCCESSVRVPFDD